MTSVSKLTCIYWALISLVLHLQEVLLLQLRTRKWKQRRIRSLTITWALVFLTKRLL
uniref:Uncharacterized protein n=1 Tax=Prolemur simus TaxID=1328070 RepID=A0A8C8ZF10_PROSS